MEQNTAPFFIGQEVVALRTSPVVCKAQLIKDHIYIVDDCRFCKKCRHWLIKVRGVFFKIPDGELPYFCCTTKEQEDFGVWGYAEYFAPVTRLRISSELTIAEGLVKDSVPESLDVAIPETVNP